MIHLKKLYALSCIFFLHASSAFNPDEHKGSRGSHVTVYLRDSKSLSWEQRSKKNPWFRISKDPTKVGYLICASDSETLKNEVYHANKAIFPYQWLQVFRTSVNGPRLSNPEIMNHIQNSGPDPKLYVSNANDEPSRWP